MPRTTHDLVKGVLLRDYDAENEPDLGPFIAAASMVVDDAAEAGRTSGRPMSGAKLSVMETWLAAHHYACSDRPYDKRTIDRDSYEMSGKTDKGYASTLYGQQAMAMDTSGHLSSVGGTDGTGSGGVAVASLSGDAGANQTSSGSTLGAPEIDASAANLSILANSVVVTGRNFDSIAANNTWSLGLGAVGRTSSASATQLILTFDVKPQATGNLMAILTNSNGTSEEAQIATVT